MPLTSQKPEQPSLIKVKKFNKLIFSRISYKITFSNRKSNQFFLPIDMVKNEIRQDLLHITNINTEHLYLSLLKKPLHTTLLKKRNKDLLLGLIAQTSEDFFNKIYGFNIKVDPQTCKKLFYVQQLLKDLEIIFQLPLFGLINPFIPQCKVIFYPLYNQLTETLLQALLENLILEIANCVVYLSLVKFSTLFVLRQTLFKTKFLSLRNFERFKNNLMWQVNIKNNIRRPIDLYNSIYPIYTLTTNGIDFRNLYANRSKDFILLTNFPLVTITLLELSDFIISRVDEVFFFTSKAIRYTLVKIVGQFLGLLWRGVIEGLNPPKNKI